MISMFNIRVYGILINDQRQVLVSDEFIRGAYITKFPGGGLEFGEGTRDCLQREFMEELNLKVKVTGHIYTTDFYQQSAFNKAHQIISIYYFVEALEPITAQQINIYEETGETESFRFINWQDLTPDTVTLPIDKHVVILLTEKNNGTKFS
jgi:ADP-ribose pyrophosphatase YjhB (NUDIX family)